MLLNNRMAENKFARRNDRLISKWVFRFGLVVYTVLFVAVTSNSSGSLIFGNREHADCDGANHFLQQSALRSDRPRGKLFRGPAGFLQVRRKAAPLRLVISLQTQTIVHRTLTPNELLLEAIRIWCQIHSASL